MYGLYGEEAQDALKAAEVLLTKAITMQDQEDELLDKHGNEIIKTGGQLAHGGNNSQVELVSAQIETMTTLAKILLEYQKIMKLAETAAPSQKVFALLNFEAEYVIKQYLTHETAIETEYGVRSQDPELNKIPKEVTEGYIQFLYLLTTTYPFEKLSESDPR